MTRYKRVRFFRTRGKHLRKRDVNALGSLIVVLMAVGLFFTILSALVAFWETPNGKLIIIGLLFTAILIRILVYVGRFMKAAKILKEEGLLRKELEERERHIQDEITKVEVSHRREDYRIEQNDYKRGNTKENMYRKAFQLELFRVFDNCCAKCGRSDQGVDIDHFFLSKNEGGCFILRHKNGHLINNAIPLCQHCNRSKSDRSYKEFFTSEEILKLFTKNVEMTKLLNKKEILDRDGNVVKDSSRKKAA